MPSDRRSSLKPAPRKLDEESGMNRTRKTKSRRDPSPASSSDDDGSQTDSSVEAYQGKSQKDDSRRPKPAAKAPNKRERNTRPTDAPQEADEDDVDKTPAPQESDNGYLTVLAMAYRGGFTIEGFPTLSRYIPDTRGLFTVLREMCQIVGENSLIHQQIPAYTSIGMLTYYAHVVNFHILRVIANEDELTRVERRILRSYEAIGPPESWPIAAPLVPFLQSLGKCNVQGGKYGTILPKFPNYAALTGTTHGLTRLNRVEGIARLPVLPALQQFVYNYAHNIAQYTDATLYPTAVPTLGADPAHFLALTSSAADNLPFQTLAFSAGWFEPAETGVDTYSFIDAQKRAIMMKWNIPEVGHAAHFTDHENFLGLQDGKDKKWIRQLLKLSSGFNKFFTGGCNLDAIPPITIEESLSKVTFNIARAADRVDSTAQGWYPRWNAQYFNLDGTIVRETSQLNLQVVSATAPRRYYGDHVRPHTANIDDTFRPMEEGPFFVDPSAPRVEIKGYDQPDPLAQASTIIESKVYNNTGKA